MSVSAPAPKLVLCENLKINHAKSSSSHHTIAVIWRVAAIVCAVAMGALAGLLLIAQLSTQALVFESILVFGGTAALTLLLFNTLWKAGSDEFEQSKFYARVAEKETEIKATWQEPEIKAFFAAHLIEFPKKPEIHQLLEKHLGENIHFSQAFIPTIALFKSLRSEVDTTAIPTINRAHEALQNLNLAMILESMHRPTSNIPMKLNERQVTVIPGVGSFDMLNAIKKIHAGEKAEAFFFDSKEKIEPLSIDDLIDLSPAEIRARVFDKSSSNEMD